MDTNQTKIMALLSSGPMQLEVLEERFIGGNITPHSTEEDGGFQEFSKQTEVVADAIQGLEDEGLVGEEFDEEKGCYVVRKI